jgi:hypothetical protein
MYDWAQYACVQCGVRTEGLIASKSFNMHCIVCYYANPVHEPCHHQGCAQELQRTLDLQARLQYLKWTLEVRHKVRQPCLDARGVARQPQLAACCRPQTRGMM